MRRAVFLLLMLVAIGGAVRADDKINLMDALGPEYAFEGGRLKVDLYPDEKVWLNGKRWPTHDDDADVRLQVGDALITASPEKWHEEGKPTLFPEGDIYRYRLERLDAKLAVFTFTTFDETVTTINSTIRRYNMGRRRTAMTFTLDLTQPHGLMVDYGPNYLEMGAGLPYRSKP